MARDTLDTSVEATHIGLQMRERVVTLRGWVANDAIRRMALCDCWYVPGVHDVRDALTVG